MIQIKNSQILLTYNAHQNEYKSSKKHEKKQISGVIVKAIKRQDPPGRFLELDSNSGCWCLVSDEKAITKTSQTLRECQCDVVTTVSTNIKTRNPSFNTAFNCNINNDSVLADSLKQQSQFSQIKYPLATLPNNKQKLSLESKSSFMNLCSYNKNLLIDLQKSYSSKYESTCYEQNEMKPCINHSIRPNSISDNMQLEDDDIDDDILMAIMDLDDDLCGSIARVDNATNSSNGLLLSQLSRKSFYSRAC